MAIEIREIVIRATVNKGDSTGQKAGETSHSTSPASAGNNNDVLQECVEQVMQVIKDKKER